MTSYCKDEPDRHTSIFPALEALEHLREGNRRFVLDALLSVRFAAANGKSKRLSETGGINQ